MRSHLLAPLLLAAALTSCSPEAPINTEHYDFVSDGIRLVGLLDTPTEREPAATIILVHGYGETDVVAGNWYWGLRSHFASLGLNVLVWDKPGMGLSEGDFDINQPVQESAREVVAAVRALQTSGRPGTERVGLWGVSRAGWIAPLAMRDAPEIAFWISVSGVDAMENARYLIASNLPIEGRSEEETARVVRAWQQAFDAAALGGSYQDYLEAATVLAEEPFMQYLGWAQTASEADFVAYQAQFKQGTMVRDSEEGLAVYVPGFDSLLSALDMPVLALFGEKDTNVNWRRTAALYRETIGRNPQASLAIRTFPDANHNMRDAVTGSVREMRSQAGDLPYVHGYLDAMAAWLIEHEFAWALAP
ncbi:MAG: alpha/beta fold hydrolase [Rhodothermales bacterium]|nr:alpha/beta fold hydrolase [Rhodothermales bacterium]MBO6780831.1 alpha/beta fold hydrolase [Rhodothermales bacterium]